MTEKTNAGGAGSTSPCSGSASGDCKHLHIAVVSYDDDSCAKKVPAFIDHLEIDIPCPFYEPNDQHHSEPPEAVIEWVLWLGKFSTVI